MQRSVSKRGQSSRGQSSATLDQFRGAALPRSRGAAAMPCPENDECSSSTRHCHSSADLFGDAWWNADGPVVRLAQLQATQWRRIAKGRGSLGLALPMAVGGSWQCSRWRPDVWQGRAVCDRNPPSGVMMIQAVGVGVTGWAQVQNSSCD